MRELYYVVRINIRKKLQNITIKKQQIVTTYNIKNSLGALANENKLIH